MTEVLGPTSYCVVVLWMHGETLGRIATAVGWSRNKTWGFVNRHFKKKARIHMAIAERQAVLDELVASRMDNGRLRDEHFRAKPLKETPPPEEVPEPPDLNTRAGRKEAKRLKKVAELEAEAARKAQEAREAGGAGRRGRVAGSKGRTTSSALEYLFDHRILKDGGDETKLAAREGFLPEESRRFEAGLRLRALIHGARTADLGAIDYERATMGTSSGPKLSLAAFKLHCIQQLGTLRKLMTKGEYVLTEFIVDADRFIWEDDPAGSKRRGEVYESIRYWLDIIGVHESLMTREAFTDRWKDTLPEVERATRGGAALQSDRVADLLEGARG